MAADPRPAGAAVSRPGLLLVAAVAELDLSPMRWPVAERGYADRVAVLSGDMFGGSLPAGEYSVLLMHSTPG
jgi:hypothetical protein